MSKVSIQGDASGTGTLTIAAPNTNSNYTLTLPTNTGTVMTSASDTFSGGLTLGGDLTLDSNGIYLGGTGAANHLDDYEEGTWTPSLTYGGSNTGVTYGISPVGYYRKIGSVVYVMFGFRLSSKGSSTGQVYIEGLPFAVSGTSSYLHPTCAVQPLIKANSKVWSGLGNNSRIQFRDMTSTADTAIFDTDVSNTSGIFGSMVYHTS
jgi:hypothetical protein